jgi:hypothetical protein
MALSPSPAFIVAGPGRRALDALSRQGREDLLDLTWAAWFASRPEPTKALLIHALDAGPEAMAGVATAEATYRLARLRAAAADDAEVVAIVDGLLEQRDATGVPIRLRRVLAASDDDRRRTLTRVRAETSDRLPRRSAETVAAVIGYLVGTRLDHEGMDPCEVPEARGFARAVMGSLGLPFDSYMSRMRGWL